MNSHDSRVRRGGTARSVHPVLERLERRELLAAGDLDPTFGTAGRTVVDFFGADNPAHLYLVATQVALLADGKVLLTGGGSGRSGSQYRIGVERLKPDGTPDSTFDGDGRVQLTFPDVTLVGDSHVSAMAVGADGKIVIVSKVTGPSGSSEYVYGVTRLNPDGTPDLTFDGDGFCATRSSGSTRMSSLPQSLYRNSTRPDPSRSGRTG